MAQFQPSPFRSLSDLIRVFGDDRRTCEVRVSGASITGRVILESGEVVHAVCGTLMGLDALFVLLGEPQVILQVHDDPQVTRRTITLGRRDILSRAAALDRRETIPSREPSGGGRPARREATRAMRVRPDGTPVLMKVPTPSPDNDTDPYLVERRGGSSFPVAIPRTRSRTDQTRELLSDPLTQVGLLVLVASLMVGGWWLGAHSVQSQLAPPKSAQAVGVPSAPPPPPVEATSLTGPGDAPPRLISGQPPRAPAVDQTLAPTIICRLLVGVDGKVQDTRIYQPRVELAPFEEAAVLAVQHYTFAPALKGGQAVAAWINTPVSFAARSGNPAAVLRIKGSDTIGGALMPALVKAYLAGHPDVDSRLEALGSATGFQGLFDGSADVGMSSRAISNEELEQARSLGLELVEHVIGYDAVALIVNPSNPVQSLTLSQLADLYSGKAPSWSAVGGDSRPLSLLGRPAYSGTHKFFLEKVVRRGNSKATTEFAPGVEAIERNEDLVRRVMSDPGAIAYVGLGFVTPEVRALAIAGEGGGPPVMASRETASSGAYPIHRPLMLYLRRDAGDAIQGLIEFILSREGQALVFESGFVPADPHAQPSAPAPTLPGSAEGAPAVEPTRVFFGSGLSKLAHADVRRVYEVGLQAKRDGRRLLVVGNGDGRSDAEGPKTALARAQDVERILKRAGVKPEAIETRADSVPVASNRTEEGRAQNRRVDLYVLPR